MSLIAMKKMKEFDHTKVPHIMNLNEDPMLNGKVTYNFDLYKKVKIGRFKKRRRKRRRKIYLIKRLEYFRRSCCSRV